MVMMMMIWFSTRSASATDVSSRPGRSTGRRRRGRGKNRRTTPNHGFVYADAPEAGASTVAYVETDFQRSSGCQSIALPTLSPSARKRFVFDGHAWIQYKLEGLPSGYLCNNSYEQIRIKFQTDAPNGLLWYIGSDDRSTHLSLKVRPATQS